MRARLAIPTLAIALSLGLSACGGGSTSASSGADATASASASATPTGVQGTFDKAQDLGGGVSVTVSAPASFKPGQYASNYIPGQVANIFTITIANTGKGPLDPTSVLFTSTSGGSACNDILDGDNGINGAPTAPVAAGASASFKIGVACDAKAGDPIDLTVSVGEKSVDITGKFA